MLHPKDLVSILSFLMAAAPELMLALRDVSVTVPTAAKTGDNVHLICNYDLEGDNLYSVKWYRGRREFYRYIPKENPAMKIFPLTGISVEGSLSNQSHVVLSSVHPSISGRFSCEVSADAPSFHTLIVSGDMEVVELPDQGPYLTGIYSRYRLGDNINGNCSSSYSKPASNLTWTINDMSVSPLQVKAYEPRKSHIDNLESSVSELNLILTHQHFKRGRLKLKCTARIYGIYEEDVSKYVEEDRPMILASGRSPDVSIFSVDQPDDGDFDKNELYLTHYKDLPSSAATIRKLWRKQMGYNILDLNEYGCIYVAVIVILLTFNKLSLIRIRRKYHIFNELCVRNRKNITNWLNRLYFFENIINTIQNKVHL